MRGQGYAYAPPLGVTRTSHSALRAGRIEDTSCKVPLIERRPHTAGDTCRDVAASIELSKVSRAILARLPKIQIRIVGRA